MGNFLLQVLVWSSFFTSLCGFQYQYQLSMAAIFKDEGPYIKEWIEYHHYMGVEHFYLYNNDSSDNFREVLAPYVDSGLVELIEWPSDQKDFLTYSFTTQPGAYTDALNRARYKSKWLALIDLDEFIFPVQEESIIECLEKKFSFWVGVTPNWQNYGTSYVEKIPDNLHIWDALVHRLPRDHERNNFYKSIVQPAYVKTCNNPHLCVYQKGCASIDTGYHPSTDKHIHTDVMVINHYWARDEWYFRHYKVPRYLEWYSDFNDLGFLTDQMNQMNDQMNQVFDNSLSIKMSKAPFLPK